MTVCCNYGNEPLCFVNVMKLIDDLTDYRMSKKEFAATINIHEDKYMQKISFCFPVM
jgi:hypothetical protein